MTAAEVDMVTMCLWEKIPAKWGLKIQDLNVSCLWVPIEKGSTEKYKNPFDQEKCLGQ